MYRRIICCLTVPIVLTCTSCGRSTESQIKEAPDARNRSELMGVPVEKLTNLRGEAHLLTPGWSGDYWPTLKGGISDRWQENTSGSRYQDYVYPIYAQSTIRGLDEEKWDRLSPAEKFDLSQGHLDFPITRAEQQNTAATADATGHIPFWFGLCHGWAPAALLEQDPGAQATVNGPFGRKIHFYSADIKALFTKLYADARVESYFLGGRCNDQVVERDRDGRPIDPACRDTNPASLHLVLANLIGEQQKGFVADIASGHQVWNQPIIGYKFAYSHQRRLASDRTYDHAAPGTVDLVEVDLDLEYLVEGVSTRTPIAPNVETERFNYTLELDRQGFIIGGEWISENRADFLWQLKRKPTLAGDSTLDYQAVSNIAALSHL